MISSKDVLETIKMIDEEYLDVRTITMGISLLDCCRRGHRPFLSRRYMTKSPRYAKDLVQGRQSRSRRNMVFRSSTSASRSLPSPCWSAACGGDPVKYALALEPCGHGLSESTSSADIRRPGAQGLCRRGQGADRCHSRGRWPQTESRLFIGEYRHPRRPASTWTRSRMMGEVVKRGGAS